VLLPGPSLSCLINPVYPTQSKPNQSKPNHPPPTTQLAAADAAVPAAAARQRVLLEPLADSAPEVDLVLEEGPTVTAEAVRAMKRHVEGKGSDQPLFYAPLEVRV